MKLHILNNSSAGDKRVETSPGTGKAKFCIMISDNVIDPPKVGELLIIEKRDDSYFNKQGFMDQFIGQIHKISEVKEDSQGYYINFEGGGDEMSEKEGYILNSWYWRLDKNCFRLNPEKRVPLKIKLKI